MADNRPRRPPGGEGIAAHDAGPGEGGGSQRAGSVGRRILFDSSPIGIREEDWSAVLPVVAGLRAIGVRDFQAYVEQRRELVLELAGIVRVRDHIATTRKAIRAPDARQPPWSRADELQSEAEYNTFVVALCALAEGERRIVVQEFERIHDGGATFLRDTILIPGQHRDDWKRIVHTTEDITYQVRTEQALRESEERLRHLIESFNAIPWEADATTWRHTYVGPQAVSILGYPQEAWYQGDFWLEHVHPEDRVLASAFQKMHASDKRHHEFEYRMLDVDGETVWVQDIVSSAHGPSGARKLLSGVMVDITERKRVELELERQRVLFETIFASVPDGLVVEDTQRQIMVCNPGFSRMFGYTEEELVGSVPRSLYADPEDFEEQGRQRFNPMAKTKILPYVTNYRRANGEIFPGEVVGSLLKDPEDRTLGYFALLRDVTERRQAEAALEFRREFQEIVVDISKRFINLDARSIDEGINEALAAIGAFAGVDRGFVCLFLQERGIVTNTHEWCAEGIESSMSRWRDVFFDALPWITERQRGGEIVHVPDLSVLPREERGMLEAEGIRSFVTVPLVGHGEVLGFLGLDTVNKEMAWSEDTIALIAIVAEIVVNALDRKRQDEALHQSEARLQAIMDNSPALMYLRDRKGRFLVVNRRFQELLRSSAAEIEGKTVHDLFPEELARQIAAEDSQVVATGEQLERERVLSGLDGKHTYVSVKFPIVDENGQVVGIGGADFDITERKRIEQQLRQAQKMEAVGQLTGGVAHDFNNLLTVVLGNLQLLQGGVAHDAENRDLVNTAIDAATRGAQLTQRLLAFSRRQLPKPELINVGKVIDGMLPLLRQTLGESIELRYDGKGTAWNTLTDPAEFESALLNLAINARDAMAGSGRLDIETADVSTYARGTVGGEEAAGEYVSVTVTDTGCGIPAEILNRVFEPFYSTKEVGKGSGLGLSMVYGFVKRSEGHLDIDSRANDGTKVTLYLPRADERRAMSRDTAVEGLDLLNGRETVLLVEDQPLVLRTVSRMLERLGYRVVQAEHPPAALEMLDANPRVDLLLTDIVMPGGMSGLDLAREVKARRPDIRVLYTTGYADAVSSSEEHGGLGAELLRKPYMHGELAGKIRSVLDR